MRAAIESGPLPPDRTLDACAQAVVWFMKGQGHIAEHDYRWFVATGRRLTGPQKPADLDPGAVSSWYRALAMVPAAEGEADRTRAYMVRAREAAEDTLAHRPRSYEMHLLKTYHESSMKEHIYVTRDPERAEEAGRDLIAMDPAWAPSYGEMAEAYLRFGRVTEAAATYERAVAAGPPYYGHHLLQAARTRQRTGQGERALAHYRTLSHVVPDDESVLSAGRDLAESLGDRASRAHFEDLLGHVAADTVAPEGAG